VRPCWAHQIKEARLSSCLFYLMRCHYTYLHVYPISGLFPLICACSRQPLFSRDQCPPAPPV
jgi:hypothetical protein